MPFKWVIPIFKLGTPGSLYSSKWDTPHLTSARDPSPRNNPISDDTWTVHMDFFRNNFSFWAIIFPILFIFFLLGTICFLEPKDHYLVARIAITLGVFAFVFTFDTILPYVKPPYILNISTFADFLLKLVLVAAIASTISSVIGFRIIAMKSNSNEGWINRVQGYNLYDVLAVVFVSAIIIHECIISNFYHLESTDYFIYPIIIIVGLGWGLFCHVIFQYHKMQKERRKRKILKVVSDPYLSKAIENMLWKKVDELREMKRKISLRDDVINNMNINELKELQMKLDELREKHIQDLTKKQGAPFGLP